MVEKMFMVRNASQNNSVQYDNGTKPHDLGRF